MITLHNPNELFIINFKHSKSARLNNKNDELLLVSIGSSAEVDKPDNRKQTFHSAATSASTIFVFFFFLNDWKISTLNNLTFYMCLSPNGSRSGKEGKLLI